jgi:hypothetical protein
LLASPSEAEVLPLVAAMMVQAATRIGRTTVMLLPVTLLPALGLAPWSVAALKLRLELAQPMEATAAERRAALELGSPSPTGCESAWVFVAPRNSGSRQRSPQSKVPEPR